MELGAALAWVSDPAAWAGLFALVTMEVVLGIDNLVFIAILANRVEPHLRDRARVLGLVMAMCLRLVLLLAVSWLVKLTKPLFSVAQYSFSGRDIIFILGGIFLLYKAITELHERLESVSVGHARTRGYARFWTVVAQIMVLDAVFSLDAVITAVGMVEHVPVMMLAVVIAVSLMLLAAKPLSNFVNAHPTVVILCLGFLLMIGFSLLVEGFGIHVPKGYLYAAIGFSVLIELFNQIGSANYRKSQAKRSLRERTAEMILRLMGEEQKLIDDDDANGLAPALGPEAEHIAGTESTMISGVLSLGERSLRSLMTPRTEIAWVNVEDDDERIREQLVEEPHSLYPLCAGDLDEVMGVARGVDVLEELRHKGSLASFRQFKPPTLAPESMDAIRLLKLMREASGGMILAVDEFGSVSGLLTPIDLFEIIAGDLNEDDEGPDITALEDGNTLALGNADLLHLEQHLDTEGLISPDQDYGTLAGLLLDKFGHLPEQGETLEFNGFEFIVRKVSDRRIEEVLIRRVEAEDSTNS